MRSGQAVNLWRLLLCLTLSGCASTPREEIVYQSLHLIDSLQTVQIARSNCHWEDAPGTKQIIGEHPSTAGAIAWGVGAGLAHWGVSHWLEDHGPRWAYWLWEGVTIGRTSYYIKQNNDQGIGLTDSNC